MAGIKTNRSLDVMALNADRNLKELLNGVEGYTPEAQSKLYYDLQQAIQHKNMSAINELIVTALPASLSNEVMSKLSHQISTAAFVRQTIEKAKIVNAFQDKKDKGVPLKPTEERWLAKKDDIEKSILKIEQENPALSDEDNLTQEDVKKLPPRTQEEEQEHQERQQERKELDQDQAAANPHPDEENILDSIPEDDRFKEKKDIDWHKIREEAIWSGLKKAADQKNPSDMAEQLFLFLALEMPLKFAESLINQIHEKRKAEKDAFKSNRANSIDTMLKAHDTNKTEVVQKLAKDMARWLENDDWKKAEEAKRQGKQLTSYQQFTLKKKAFADKLPRKEDGNFDFNKFSKRQKRRYASYMSIYATIPPFRNYIAKVMGVRLRKKEIKDYVLQALNVKTKHTSMPSHQQAGQQQMPTPERPLDPSMPTPTPERPLDPSMPTPTPERPRDPSMPTPTPERPRDPSMPTPTPERPRDPSMPTPTPERPRDPSMPTPTPQTNRADKKVLRDELNSILTAQGIELPKKMTPDGKEISLKLNNVEDIEISGSASEPKLVMKNGKKVPLKIQAASDEKAQEVIKRLTEWKKKMEQLRANQEAINRARNNTRDMDQPRGRDFGRGGM